MVCSCENGERGKSGGGTKMKARSGTTQGGGVQAGRAVVSRGRASPITLIRATAPYFGGFGVVTVQQAAESSQGE